MPRLERRIRPISGQGGRLEIYHEELDAYGVRHPKIGGILDVGRWQVDHRQVLREVTHSGSNGAIKRALVARDFTWACQCPWHSTFGKKSDQDVLLGFLEQILTGPFSNEYNVAMRFYLGDPLHYRDPTKFAYLYAPLCLAENWRTINDCLGKDVVRLDFNGSGNSLLEGWRGAAESADKKFGGVADAARDLYQ